jgi:organic hydroperoxide reductase OsmC/OhrA
LKSFQPHAKNNDMAKHRYQVQLEWTGNRGSGTEHYRAYGRDHLLKVNGKTDLLGSADPSFLGDPTRHNPEEMLVAALSACHMLWYLHLCADAGIVVTDYRDAATGIMEETRDGGGHFLEVTLYPVVSITDKRRTEEARTLHDAAHDKCFIANSCNFPVKHRPSFEE